MPQHLLFVLSWKYRQFRFTCLHLCCFHFQKSKRKKCNVATQTEDGDETHSDSTPGWSTEGTNKKVEESQSLAEQVKEAAQSAMQLTGFVYEETSGMYYDYNTGYYYNAVSMIF
jgi:hypothetical protein